MCGCLTENRADVNGKNITSIPALCPDHEKSVEILIQAAVRSIMKAARWGCDRCIATLIQGGADVNVQDDELPRLW